MAVTITEVSTLPVRKRKAHKKSRAGCANCKMRRVKCDEAKPQCAKCLEFRVACSYETKTSFDNYETGSFQVIPLKQAVSTHESMLSMVHENHISVLPWKSQKGYRFNVSDLETLDKFQNRTVHTIGTPIISGILRNELVRYACKDPPLMHALLTITLAHDRVMVSPFAQPESRELYHMNQSIRAVSHALSNPDSLWVSDTIWATATLMGAITFCILESDDPAELWPNKETDLAWLKMSEGKSLVHKMLVSTKLDSPAQKLASIHHASTLRDSIPYEDFLVLPTGFIEVFGIDKNSDASNPYYTPICFLAQLWHLEANQSNVLHFTNYLTRIDPGYRKLLLDKDPRALLAIAWWWAMAGRFQQWWHGTRARIEGQAVCLYLSKHHGHEWYIQEFLPFAQVGCGLLDTKHLCPAFERLDLKTVADFP